MGMLLAAVIALVALILAPGQLFYYDVTPKICVLLLGTAIALWRPLPRTAGLRLFSLLVMSAIASLVLSTIASVNPTLSLYGTNWRRFGLLTQAAVLALAWLLAHHVAARPEHARTVLRGAAAAGIIASLYGIAQYFGWDPILPAAGYHIGEGIWMIVRPPGTLGYSSYFATWLTVTVFFDVALAQMEQGALRYAAFGAAALAAIAMVLTGTRAALLGLAAGGLVWLFRRRFRISPRWLAAAAAIAVAATAFYYSPPGWRLRSRARWFREDRWGGARLALWRDTITMGLHRPILGYGPEVFTAEFPRFESKALAGSYPDFLYESPHNMFLDAWAAQGVPGLVILAALCWLGLHTVWRRKEPATTWIAAALTGAIVCQQFTAFTMPTALIFYVALALGIATAAVPAAELSRPSRSIPWRPIAAVIFAAFAARLLYQDIYLEQTQKAFQRGDLAIAQSLYEHTGNTADIWFSRESLKIAQRATDPVLRLRAVAMAGAAAQRATRTAEDPFNAWYNLAVLYGIQNNGVGAESSLRAAIAARPNWFKPHWMLSQVLRVEGRNDEARREAAIAADLDKGKHLEILHPQL